MSRTSIASQWWRYPLWTMAVLGSSKSFRTNPVIGSPGLNERGLHRARVKLAADMAARRRKWLAPSVRDDERQAFDRDGYVIRENALPREVFERLVETLHSTPLPAREMRQGQAVTRMIPLGPNVLSTIPDLKAFTAPQTFAPLIRYVAGLPGEPVYFIQTVIAEPAVKKADPQITLHADTFHSTAKAWLFLQDVGPDDGPFVFVPGSHHLTPERLEWEHRQSLAAHHDDRQHHASGSFRISPEELQALGDFTPQKVTVPANTIVVADTYAFHSRATSPKHTIRAELHAYHRGNPFSPLPFSLSSLPGFGERRLDMFLAYEDWLAKRRHKRPVWQDVGESTAFDGAHI
ncbi:phytanoyl-CoA dioxygenase family protein [Ciceribacter sp. L1K23]|uniref:phytanoyl-CoA dioxygenase family protein n=1 Tax=Ciceribacter sp. L1K23 TaxID=2820276 RepID=UPI001B82628E|nr:phytanoyl-CoA dioxygenase family protein [Ciceribacter sp. L1K23]MBR0554745.1 phytanoyl-CoA dioxygenase family protein [Ciceribacter sp. L1K23]